tara:strand:- start:349 stop:540 length:192 start_codon:yes stop_codon:yes gene_type:complete
MIWRDDHDLSQKKPRALTYSEMINGGRPRIDVKTHERELEMHRREIILERQVNYLEESLKIDE